MSGTGRKNSKDWIPGEARAQFQRELDNMNAQRPKDPKELTEEEKFLRMSENQRRASLRTREDDDAFRKFQEQYGKSFNPEPCEF